MLGTRDFRPDSAADRAESAGFNVIESSVARRYARALFSLAQDGGKGAVEAIGAQLAALYQGLSQSEETRALLQQGTPIARQRGVVEALAGQVDPLLANFLCLLVERQRLEGLQQIALAFTGMVDAHLGRVRAVVSAPLPLEDAEIAGLQAALAAATGKTIQLDQRLDPSLIGGVAIEAAGVLYDGSLRTQLARLRDQLQAG